MRWVEDASLEILLTFDALLRRELLFLLGRQEYA
jgi:hypothetical protein